MQEKIATLAPRNVVTAPGGKVEISIAPLAPEGPSCSVNYQLMRFRASGARDVASSGSFVIEGAKNAKISFDAPGKAGDYKFFVACDGRLERRPVRVIVTDTKVVTEGGVNLLAEETDLLAGLFWSHQTVVVKKALRAKIYDTKLLLCFPSNNGGAGGVIVKVGPEYEVREEYLNLQVLTAELGEKRQTAFPAVADYLYLKSKAALVYGFGENVVINDAETLIDWAERHSEDEICLTMKLLFEDILGEALYSSSQPKASVSLFKEYHDAAPGVKIFGLMQPAPAIKISSDESGENLSVPGEHSDRHPERFMARGKISKIFDKAMLVTDQQAEGHHYTIYIKNPDLRKEKLNEIAREPNLSFVMSGHPPLGLADFYREAFASESVSADRILDAFREFKKELPSIRVSAVHGNLHPRNVLVTDDGTILLVDFESFEFGRPTLCDFAKMETYLKLWGVIPKLTGVSGGAVEKAVSQEAGASEITALLAFDRSLDEGRSSSDELAVYHAAIMECRRVAAAHFFRKNDRREYAIALFMSELAVLKYHHGSLKGRTARFITALAENRAAGLYGGQAAVPAEAPSSKAAPAQEVLGTFMCIEAAPPDKGVVADREENSKKISALVNTLLRPLKKSVAGGTARIMTNVYSEFMMISLVDVMPEDALNFLINMAGRMARDRVSMRMGVSSGYCSVHKNMAGDPEAVGAGPVAAKAVCALGRSGHILTTEQFFRWFAGGPFERVFEKVGVPRGDDAAYSGPVFSIVTGAAGNTSQPSKVTKRPGSRIAKSGKTKIANVTVSAGGARPLSVRCLSGPYEGKDFALAAGENTIGRSRKCTVSIPDAQYVSGHHAMIVVDGNRITLRDTESTNGTFVGGRRISEERIEEGAEFVIADVCFRLVAAGD